VSRPDPHRQRQSRPMQHRARRHRGLPPAPLALPQRPGRQLEGVRLPAAPTAKAVGPPAGGQVLPTRLVVPKSGLELLQGLGEIGSAHLTTLSMGAFGVNPIGISCVTFSGKRRSTPSPRFATTSTGSFTRPTLMRPAQLTRPS